jgi:hypothetical protein
VDGVWVSESVMGLGLLRASYQEGSRGEQPCLSWVHSCFFICSYRLSLFPHVVLLSLVVLFPCLSLLRPLVADVMRP